jgi:tetratricopeptide (TPR) repeat protein
MNQPHDPKVTADIPSAPADHLDAGLTADFAKRADPLASTDCAPGSASTEGSHPSADAPASDLPTVPGYRVLREIARGGMGRVLAAHDLTLGRDVALKGLLPGANADRFVRESKITARLPHPGIPPVHALGTLADGSPFLAMKLIAGRTLADEIKTADRPRLLQAFTQVCQAVGFAHSRGVIHRDLKPANVMVGAFGEVQVMDWGLAKDLTSREVADESRSSVVSPEPIAGTDPIKTTDQRSAGESTDDQTQAGTVLGTPAYMAPEQARGEAADARADVFALGSILCAILTGQPPFRGKSSLEIIQRAGAADLAEANARLDHCQVDKELIALCRGCLRPNPIDRPVNGQAVADGLTAYLNGVQDRLQGVERERAVAVAKAIEERRRRKVQVIAASLVLFVLLAGISGTTVGLVQAREQRKLADDRYEQLTVANANTETERNRAVQNFGTARTLILDLGNRIGQIETGQTNPKLADQARKQALDKAREQFDQFRAGQPDDVMLMKQAALLHRFAANVSRTLNDYPAAMTAYAAAIQISEELTARFPDHAPYRNELALTLSDRSGLERLTGKLKEATATLDRALLLAEGPQGNAFESARRRTLAMIVMDQTDVAYLLGRFEDAASCAIRGSALWDQVITAPAAESLAVDPLFAAMAVHRVALAQRELGNTAKAMTAHDDAVARMKLLAGPKATRDVRYWDSEVRRERARTAVAVPERRAAAIADLAEVILPSEKLIEENPHLYFYKAGLASVYLYRGELLLALDQPEPATAELTKSLAVSRELIDRHGVLTRSMLIRGNTYLALGRARAAAGKPDEAAVHWTKAAKVFELALQIDPDNFHHRRGLTEARYALNPAAK